ncbi:MAG: helix-turn-helix domain-containing protein [Candidatus Cloacimonetes bacterium]|nr:helix-turn-helix domain-containing protein [Candidatus Cloacimonadota bacterium]
MESLGKYFLDLRLQRDISYRKVWEDIRIREEIVRCIEENRFFDLGDYGIAKALVYNYARYLEADLDAVLKEFRLMMPETVKCKFHPCKALKDKKIMLSTNFLWMVGIVIFAIILASILLHAHRQGWLKAPDFFNNSSSVSTDVVKVKPIDESEPDSLRIRMKALSEAMPSGEQMKSTAKKSKAVPADTTDYMGSIMGNSPLNVPLH